MSETVQKVTILGGGVMGSQIALVCAWHGFDTTIWLRSESSIGRTKPKLSRYSRWLTNYMAGTASDVPAETGRKRLEEKLRIELDLKKALSGAEIVIESIIEDREAKTVLFEAARGLMEEKTLLCTNSSTLLPSGFAPHTGRPERFCCLHFSNMIWQYNLAEVMGHAGTAPETLRAVAEFASAIGMVPVMLRKEKSGYLLNSMLLPFLNAAQKLWAGGVSDPADIDKAWQLATGAPAGPFRILDFIGLETVYTINQLMPGAQREGSLEQRVCRLLQEKIERGETGMHAGKGFYDDYRPKRS